MLKHSTKIGQARIPTGLQKTTSTRSVLHRHALKSSMNTAGIQYCRKGIGQRKHRCTTRKWQLNELMTVCITQTHYITPWHGIQAHQYCTIIIISFFFPVVFSSSSITGPHPQDMFTYIQKSTAVLTCLPNQSHQPPSSWLLPQKNPLSLGKSISPLLISGGL